MALNMASSGSLRQNKNAPMNKAVYNKYTVEMHMFAVCSFVDYNGSVLPSQCWLGVIFFAV